MGYLNNAECKDVALELKTIHSTEREAREQVKKTALAFVKRVDGEKNAEIFKSVEEANVVLGHFLVQEDEDNVLLYEKTQDIGYFSVSISFKLIGKFFDTAMPSSEPDQQVPTRVYRRAFVDPTLKSSWDKIIHEFNSFDRNKLKSVNPALAKSTTN